MLFCSRHCSKYLHLLNNLTLRLVLRDTFYYYDLHFIGEYTGALRSNLLKIPKLKSEDLKTMLITSACYCCWSVVQLCWTLLWSHGLYTVRPLCPCDFPGEDSWVGCRALLQGNLLHPGTGLELESPALQADSLLLVRQGSPTSASEPSYMRMAHHG